MTRTTSVMRRWTLASLGLLPLARPAWTQTQTPADTAARAVFITWARHVARPFPRPDAIGDSLSSLQWLVDLAHAARVIGVGEGAHDVHEFLTLRGDITKALIERGRVAAIAMETGLAEGASLGEWLAGRDPRLPDFEHDLSYGFGSETEIVETLKWVREYNSHRPPSRQVHFYGVDLPADGGGSLPPGERDTLRCELVSLAARFNQRKTEYIARSSLSRFLWAERLVAVARQTEEAVRIGWNAPNNPRDEAMADNIEWIARREGQRGLVVVWAHNLHVSRAAIAGPLFAARGGPPVASMGHYLGGAFGDRYVAIGTAFRTGGPDSSQTPDALSVDAALTSVGVPRFGLSIRGAPARGAVAAWLAEPHLMRAENGYVVVRMHPAYDALLFVDSVRTADHAAPAR